MKHSNKARQVFLASLLAGSTVLTTGCSTGGFSLASVNPFSKPVVGSPDGTNSGLTQSIAAASGGAKDQFTNLGSATKNALAKTSGAVAGVFRGKGSGDNQSESDPLSLSNRPKNVDPEVFVANGQLWESTGDLSKAMESYTKALEQDPEHSPALTSIARLHFRQNNHQAAASSFRLAIAKNPQDAGLHNDLGLTLSKLKDYTGATTSLQKSLEIAPGTSRYANNLATIHFENGNPNGAYQVLEKNNKAAVAHFNMAYLHYKSGQVSQARNQLNQSLQYQTQSEQDPVIQRAVERSRDMLAQIDGVAAPVAQAAPQATIAGGHFFQSTPAAPVQQTSQSSVADAPAIQAVIPPAKPSYKTSSRPLPQKIQTSTMSSLPKKVQWSKVDTAATKSPMRPMPTRPSSGTSAVTPEISPAPPTETKSTSGASASHKTANQFELPSSFDPSMAK